MIIIIAYKEENTETGRLELVASHGIDTTTDQMVVVPNIHPAFLGATFNYDIGEYVLQS